MPSSRQPPVSNRSGHRMPRPTPTAAPGWRGRPRRLLGGVLAAAVLAAAVAFGIQPTSAAGSTAELAGDRPAPDANPAGVRPARNEAAAAQGSAQRAGGPGQAGANPAGAAAAAVFDSLRVQGNRLVDTCGNPFLVRGAETFLGLGIDVNGSRLRVVQEMVSTGVNAVRLIPNVRQLSLSEIEQFLIAAEAAKVVVFLTPNGGRSWFGRSDVKTMLNRHKKWLIIDAYGEAPYDDRNRWQNDVVNAIREVRSFGYTVPLVVLSNQYGRDLPALLQRGAAIEAADPLHNTVLGWQAYWGTNGWYQGVYGMSLTEGVRRSAQQSFPIQIGIDHFADPGIPMDYQAAMTAAQQNRVGWLWWDWYNPFGRTDNLTQDGTAARLTDVGRQVINTHAAGIRATAVKACGS